MLPRRDNILVIPHSRSGGKMMRKLLDGHPAIRAAPFEHWHSAGKAKFPPDMHRFAELDAVARAAMCGCSDLLARKIENHHGPAGVETFMRSLLEEAAASTNSPDLYERFANLYFGKFQGLGPERRTVNHCGSLALLPTDKIEQMFGPFTRIMSWRDPRAVYVSARDLGRRKEKPRNDRGGDIGRFCEKFRTTFDNHHGGEGIAVHFERLVADPGPEMRRVAAALGIHYSDTLLTPTRFGQPDKANSSRRPRRERSFGAIDSTAATDWRHLISSEERATIEDRLGDVMAALGYTD